MKRTSMFFDDGQMEQLQALSERTSQPVAKLVRRSVDHFLLLAAESGGVAEAVQMALQVFDDSDTLERAAARALVRWKHDRESNSLRGRQIQTQEKLDRMEKLLDELVTELKR